MLLGWYRTIRMRQFISWGSFSFVLRPGVVSAAMSWSLAVGLVTLMTVSMLVATLGLHRRVAGAFISPLVVLAVSTLEYAAINRTVHPIDLLHFVGIDPERFVEKFLGYGLAIGIGAGVLLSLPGLRSADLHAARYVAGGRARMRSKTQQPRPKKAQALRQRWVVSNKARPPLPSAQCF